MKIIISAKNEKIFDSVLGGKGKFGALINKITKSFRISKYEIDLHFKIVSNKTIGGDADAAPVESFLDGRKSTIRIAREVLRKYDAKVELIRCLLHEGKHLQQFLTKKYSISECGFHYWKGVRHVFNDANYRTRLWEIEAYRAEKLFKRFI